MKVIQIDDAGWGFPLGGVLIGAMNVETNEFVSGEIPVTLFNEKFFKQKFYLGEAARLSVEHLMYLKADKKSFEIHLCPGYIHNETEKLLSQIGYKVIRKKIEEPLQPILEKEFRDYIMRIVKKDIYFDPKEMSQIATAETYRRIIALIDSNNMWNITKTGWKSIKKYINQKRQGVSLFNFQGGER